MNMYTTYVLVSKTSNTRYTGSTSNIDKRLADHNSGMSRYTKNRGPWVIVHTEEYSSRAESIAREKFLKTGKGREYIDQILKQ